MIYVLCSGGLGNQMFQYVFFKHLIESGKDAILDTSFFQHSNIHSGYALERAFGITETKTPDHFSSIWKLKYSLMSRLGVGRFGNTFMELNDKPIDESSIGNNAVLYGYWQGYKFIDNVRDKVVKRLIFQNLSNRSINLGTTMAGEESVAIHIRRGDYLKNPKYVNLSEMGYYSNSLAEVNRRYANPHYYIFSNDVSWCRSSGLFDGNSTYVDFNDDQHAYEDMYLMTQAKAIITANSSFSWWAGYLGNHDFVIRPEKYQNKWTNSQDQYLYPTEWIIGKFGGRK